MNFNFELILFYAVVITGVIALVDILFFHKNRQRRHGKQPAIVEYARSFFPILLIVFLLRSFLFEPYRIPSASLEPTLLTGDFIIVNKFSYGVRLPVMHKKVYGDATPKRGDIIVFRWPAKTSYNFIKRVIGLPGDHVQYINKELIINGEKISQGFLKSVLVTDESGADKEVDEKMEHLLGIDHHIYNNPARASRDYDIIVPKNNYFVMGDNRDDSADGRYFGFVPDQNIIGKAIIVWLSWDNINTNLRWHRMGSIIR